MRAAGALPEGLRPSKPPGQGAALDPPKAERPLETMTWHFGIERRKKFLDTAAMSWNRALPSPSPRIPDPRRADRDLSETDARAPNPRQSIGSQRPFGLWWGEPEGGKAPLDTRAP